MLNEKYEALKNYLIEAGKTTAEELIEDLSTVYNGNWETFEIIGEEYKVYTNEEADKAAIDYIKDSLWAFNTDFILQHSVVYEETTAREDEEIIKALRMVQENICEGSNTLVKALISDIDRFIEDAIDADGRGNFLSSYDGKEHKSNGFYICRMN